MKTLKAHPEAGLYDSVASVEKLVELIDKENCTPGWVNRRKPILWPTTRSEFKPAHWSYARLKPALVAAGRVIGTDQAERRNFVLRNPVEGNDFATTRTLVGAYQSILPGEKARSHRHVPHALRVILESKGSYSVVNGVKHPMESGDIVLTPGNHWHGHGHEGDEQAFWFDCLDVPLVHLLEPMSFEDHPDHWEPIVAEAESSEMRLASADIQRLLAEAGTGNEGFEFFGKTINLSTPALPTISIQVHQWDQGWANKPYRHSANAIHVVLGGSGSSQIDDCRFEWGFGDVLAVPMGAAVRHQASSPVTVVTLSDEPVMRFCGFYKFESI
jgi:gentisate 1,2-dioxygenase